MTQITVTTVKESKAFKMMDSQRISPNLSEEAHKQQVSMCMQHGFTMLELMIVLAILGVMLAIAIPAFSEWREHSAVNNATNSLFVRLKQARALAVAESRDVKVFYDTANAAFIFDYNDGTCDTDVCKHLEMDLSKFSKNLVLATNAATITFNRKGTATNSTTKIASGNYYKCVVVNIIGRAYISNAAATCTVP